MSKGQEPIGSEAGQAEERKSPVKKETAPGAGSGISRRNFLRMGGVAAAAATLAGGAAAGFQVGRSPDAYSGWGRAYSGADQFFDREPFRTDVPAMMTPVGQTERPDWYDFFTERNSVLGKMLQDGVWNPGMGLAAMPGQVGDFFRAEPVRLERFLEAMKKSAQREKDWKEKKHLRYAIADAYSRSFHETGLVNRYGSTVEEPHELHMQTGKPVPPEEWDYRHIWRDKPLTFKSPAHASKLIKQMAYQFGASIVGIAKFDPRFMAKNLMRGMPNRGHDSWGDKVPEHWKSIIVLGVPMNWDPLLASMTYSSSYDAYFRVRNAVGLLERFLMEIGHPARGQFPPRHYEIMMPPYVLLSGLGEHSRVGIAMVPEFGLNVRPAAVITDIEFEYDRPIDVKMADFCKKCKICAEACPAGCISFDDEPQTVVRGFKRWAIEQEKCFIQWTAGPATDVKACRVCMSVCPYTRKNTWIHTISREMEPRDPTGAVSTGLLAMQQNFFNYPAAEDFRADWDGGKEATYHNPPWWERSEDFFVEVKKDWDYYGLE